MIIISIVVVFLFVASMSFLFMLIIGLHEKRIQKLEQTIIKDRVFVADLLNEQLKNR